MKNNISFFTHEVEASEHRKFLILRTHYGEGDKGWAMEGRFWRLNSLIGKADNCRLDTNLKGEKARIAHDLGLGLKDLDEFLTVLETESELIHNENGVIWTDQTQDDLKRAESARSSARKRKFGFEKDGSGELSQSSGELSQSSGEKTHGAEQEQSRSREDRRGEELGAAGAPVELDQESRDLLAFALRRAVKRKAKNPEAMALKLVTEPDVIADFERERSALRPKARDPSQDIPPPPRCDCPDQGEIVTVHPGDRGRCKACRAIWEFNDDPEIRIWLKAEDGVNSKTG